MSENRSKTPEAEFIALIQRHTVPIAVSYESDGVSRGVVISTFVMSVSDVWFLITAGHVIQLLDELTANPDSRIAATHLMDGGGFGASYPDPIPFDIVNTPRLVLGGHEGFDYAVFPLGTMYRRLLEANQVRALDADAWRKQPKSVMFYGLFGFPNEFVERDSPTPKQHEARSFRGVFHFVEKITNPPACLRKKNAPRFYGYVQSDGRNGTPDVAGMSGGPIFAFQHYPDKGLCYWLIAMQSSRDRNDHRSIAGCPTKVFGDALEEFLDDVVNVCRA